VQPSHLADLTEQIELVIQKYLRNEYDSIGDYNADAEVPEPYRFVVVANFPANFTETSARRLASIAASGARCARPAGAGRCGGAGGQLDRAAPRWQRG
jgi:hypothetical protein